MRSGYHQRFNNEFFVAVARRAQARGLKPYFSLGLFRADDDYRVPDQLFAPKELIRERGADGAELIVEICSPGDDTHSKIGFYAAMGVRELLILHHTDATIELLRADDGSLVPVQPTSDGSFECEVLGITLRAVEGKLRITWPDGSAEIWIARRA